jgi:hypothetical protein
VIIIQVLVGSDRTSFVRYVLLHLDNNHGVPVPYLVQDTDSRSFLHRLK